MAKLTRGFALGQPIHARYLVESDRLSSTPGNPRSSNGTREELEQSIALRFHSAHCVGRAGEVEDRKGERDRIDPAILFTGSSVLAQLPAAVDPGVCEESGAARVVLDLTWYQIRTSSFEGGI